MTVKQIQHLLGYLGTSQGRPRQAPSGISVDGICGDLILDRIAE